MTELLTLSNANGNFYYSHDALGSVTHLSDASASVVERYTYDAFGSPTIYDSQFTIHAASAAGNRFLFTGREYLAALNLYDYRNRIYSPSLGRFLQTDPIGFEAGDENIYRYVGNSVVNDDDPWGLNGRRSIIRPQPIRQTNRSRTAEENLKEEHWRREMVKRGLDPDYKPSGPWRPPEMRATSEREPCPETRAHGHHPLPKFLGGDANQLLNNLDPKLHSEFHNTLRQNLRDAGIPLNVGGKGGSMRDWAEYMQFNPGAQRTAFDSVLNASRSIDAKYGTQITRDVWQNVTQGNFTPYP